MMRKTTPMAMTTELITPRSSYLMREALRRHQRSSEVIRGHQRSSKVIRGHHTRLLVRAEHVVTVREVIAPGYDSPDEANVRLRGDVHRTTARIIPAGELEVHRLGLRTPFGAFSLRLGRAPTWPLSSPGMSRVSFRSLLRQSPWDGSTASEEGPEDYE
jgi:hypothetical protein